MRKEKKVGSFNIDTYRTLAEKAKKRENESRLSMLFMDEFSQNIFEALQQGRKICVRNIFV